MQTDKKHIAVIGSGFSGLTTSALLAARGYRVTVYEKNDQVGGRARFFQEAGFTFDMGPSWYWMPDVFERYFQEFGSTTHEQYELVKLEPGFQVIFGQNESYEIPGDATLLEALFERIEPGAGLALRRFLQDAAYKYQVGMNELVYQPAHSFTEFMKVSLIKDSLRLQVFSSFSKHAAKHFRDHRLRAIIEFPVLFLGAMPKDTPALYSLMNHAGLTQGTYYPMGGFAKVIHQFKEIALKQGVEIQTSCAVEKLLGNHNNITTVRTEKENIVVDAVVAAADYAHVESRLLPTGTGNYSESYWEKKVFAPSSLIFYLGVNKEVPRLKHHNLFFDESFEQHSREIYLHPQWPEKPLFYVCCPSKTDPDVAPAHHENIFILIPIAAGLSDSEEIKEKYYEMVLSRMEAFCGTSVREHIVFKKSYSVTQFKQDYNAYKGNAYGLANTLLQTAFLKPKIRNKHWKNLYYTGQLTVPGPGVPPSIISGQIVARELDKQLRNS